LLGQTQSGAEQIPDMRNCLPRNSLFGESAAKEKEGGIKATCLHAFKLIHEGIRSKLQETKT